jgi:hypothetical protein
MSIKSWFVKEEESQIPPQKTAPASKPAPVYNPTPLGTSTPVVPIQGGKDYMKTLRDELEKNNLPGLDLLEFMKGLEALANTPLMEPQKYQTQAAIFSSQGVTPEKLKEAGQHYLTVLDKEKQSFDQSLKASRKTAVDDKYTEIAKLQAQIEESNKRIQQLSMEASASQQKLSIEDNAFQASWNQLYGSFQAVITNINNYLSTTTQK